MKYMRTNPLVQEAPFVLLIQRLHRSTLGLMINIISLESNILSKQHWLLTINIALVYIRNMTMKIGPIVEPESETTTEGTSGRYWLKYLMCHLSFVPQVPHHKARYLSLISPDLQMALHIISKSENSLQRFWLEYAWDKCAPTSTSLWEVLSPEAG